MIEDDNPLLPSVSLTSIRYIYSYKSKREKVSFWWDLYLHENQLHTYLTLSTETEANI